MGLNRVCLYGPWLSPVPGVQLFFFNFKLCILVSVCVLNNVLESVSFGLRLLGPNPGPATLWWCDLRLVTYGSSVPQFPHPEKGTNHSLYRCIVP